MKNVVPEENCLTEVQLLRYLHDECRTDEVRAIDRHLTHCPMCSDALEGVMLLGKGRLERSLKHLDAQINTGFSSKTTIFELEKPVMTVVKKPKSRLWLWAAASVAIVVTAGIMLLTKPVEPLSTLPTVANTEGEALPTERMPDGAVSTQNGETQANSLKNGAKTGTDKGLTDNKLTETADLDVPKTDERSVAATTTTSGASIDGVTTKPQAMKTTEDTEGGAFGQKKSKDADAKREEMVYGDAYRSKEKQAQTTSQSDNNYPGAAAQNVVTESKVKATREKQMVDNGLADYQIGMQYYTKEDYNQAIAQLNRVLAKQNKGILYENALWYLANSYLKLGKKQDGQALLQRIVGEKGKYAQQAAALLK